MIAHRFELTKAEVQSGLDRVRYAEGLILQLPIEHDGRNSWLLNYGTSIEAQRLQERRGLVWDETSRSSVQVDEEAERMVRL